MGVVSPDRLLTATVTVEAVSDTTSLHVKHISAGRSHGLAGKTSLMARLYEGPRTRVDQPKIKYWKLHKLCKKCNKTYIPYEHVVRNFKFLNVQELLKCILRVFPYLGGLTQHLWVSPLWFSALHIELTDVTAFIKGA